MSRRPDVGLPTVAVVPPTVAFGDPSKPKPPEDTLAAMSSGGLIT